MKTAIIGKKVGMTQIFDEAGKVVPVTVIEAGPCTVTGKMTKEKEGYEAVQLGYEDIAEKKLTKPEKGHLDKAGVGYKKHLKEFRLEDCASVNVGDVIKADTFKEGDKVDITGISKGHGYAGVIKRFGQGRTRPPTAAVLCTVTPAPWARAPILPVSSRARSRPATWAWIRSPSRTSTWSRSIPSST